MCFSGPLPARDSNCSNVCHFPVVMHALCLQLVGDVLKAVPTHRMRYFDQTGRRREPTMMYVEGGFSDTSKTNMNTVIGLNVAAGPHRKHFAALYEVEQALREDSLAFMHQLTPWSRRRACTTHLSQTLFRRDYSLTGASLYMCRVPGIHEDFQVMLTMACNPCDDMYAEHGQVGVTIRAPNHHNASDVQ